MLQNYSYGPQDEEPPPQNRPKNLRIKDTRPPRIFRVYKTFLNDDNETTGPPDRPNSIEDPSKTYDESTPLRERHKLTEREIEILHCSAQGLSQDIIANTLRVSRRTIEEHLKSARMKLNAKNTNHAIALAVSRKIFTVY